MNEYKRAWLSNIMLEYPGSKSPHLVEPVSQKNQNKSIGDAATFAAKQKAEATLVKGAHAMAKHASQSQLKGRLGIGLRVGGRVGTRFIPIVGSAMLVYDLYRLYEHVTE